MVQPPNQKLPNVLVVCHGNICRSPLAAEVLRGYLGADRVRDRGIKGTTGVLAAKKVREWAASVGYDLGGHRSTPLASEDVGWAGLIVYMDNGNRRRLLADYPEAENKAECLGQCIGAGRIPDPNYLRGEELFRVLELVVRAAKALGQKITPGYQPGEVESGKTRNG